MTSSFFSKLMDALEQSDKINREARTNRIIWMSQHNQRPGIVMGHGEALGVLSEAENAFRDGNFISVIILALAYIEHDLTDSLIRMSLANFGVSLNQAINIAREHKVLEEPLIERINHLRLVRNPFAHLKHPEHCYSFSNRFREKGVHPQALLEEDAREAFEIMFLVFRALLIQIA